MPKPNLALPLLIAAAVGACSVNPATGERQFTGLLPAGQEAALGAREHPRIVAQFGGVYEDPELQAYVEGIGRRIAAATETPGVDHTFTVLDSEVANAFALPGGYVYVTRGMAALANSEAELAGVIAHEIAHVAARHAAERVTKSTLANLLALGAGIATGSQELTQALGIGSDLVVRGWSREQELEADRLGIRYLAAAGYEPLAMARFLEQMGREAELRAAIAGRAGEAATFNYFSTHPPTGQRVERAVAAAVGSPAEGIVDRDAHLAAIDGMVYGDSPEEGFVRGRAFVHPALGFRFEVPPGYRLLNGREQVVAAGPDAAIVFDSAPRRGARSVVDYLTRVWTPDLALEDVEAIEIDGLPAATGTAHGRSERGPVDVRLVAIGFSPDRVYRFVFVTEPGRAAATARELREVTYSFARLAPAEAALVRPLRIEIATVGPGDTVESLAARMPFDRLAEERFRVLNGLAPDEALVPGQRVKLVVG